MFGTIVDQLFQNLMALAPFVILKSYEGGVRWRLGRKEIELKPGIHWRIPLYHQVEKTIVTDEMMELPVQSVITKDKKLVCFRVAIGFRIVDVVAHFNNVQDFFESTRGIAQMHLSERVRAISLEDLESDLSKLERSLRGTLTTKMKRWGTEVYEVGFTDFAEVPNQIRHFIDNNTHAISPLGLH